MRRDVLDESRYNGGGVGGIGRGGDWGHDRHTIVEMRGRNGKWLRTGNRRAIWVVGVNVIGQFGPRIAQVSHHERVRSKNGGRNRWGSVNGKEGVDGGKLAADFFFLNIEEAGDMLDHLLMGEC